MGVSGVKDGSSSHLDPEYVHTQLTRTLFDIKIPTFANTDAILYSVTTQRVARLRLELSPTA